MMTNGKMTIATALNDAVATLSLNKTIENPRLDAEVLLCEVLKCERIFLVINKDKPISDDEFTLFSDFIARRHKNEPVSYIIGTKEFMSLDFYVTDGVLIPRPDTEILVEKVIELFKNKQANIVDLCTGSGAIAVSLAYYLDKCSFIAVDKYDICLETAQQNAKKHGVDKRIDFIKADVLENFELSKEFDCIVSNPPYIRKDVLSSLPDDVKNFEPEYALDGGDDGLIFYRKITDFACTSLKKGGVLGYEIGFDQGESVCKILDDTDEFSNISVIKDLAGLDRVVIAEKR